MKAPITWLKDYVDIDISPKELAEKLLKVGFEVEEVIYLGEGIENVVVGKILAIERHPNADKLKVCQINVGKETLQIVTNSDSVRVGDFVPVALHGAKLATGQVIEKGELRGVKSFGMLCGGEDIKLSQSIYSSHDLHGVLIFNDKNLQPGDDVKKVMGLDEYILDISITANRPDCQGIYGIAREVAAATNKKVKPLKIDYKIDESSDISKILSVTVQNIDICPKYMLGAVHSVSICESNEFIQKRLKLCGLRPINNIVDITNFILLELGQPMHAFDYSLLEGNCIVVKTYDKGVSATALDEKQYKLTSEMLTISDSKKPVAIAGVMGGLNSAINNDTKTVAFESAVFARQSIRRTSRKLNLKSDSSSMYEKGVSSYSCEMGLLRALYLVDKFGYGKICKGYIDKQSVKTQLHVIKTTFDKINSTLGLEIKKDIIQNILKSLDFEVKSDSDNLIITVPPYRTDIDRYPDIAEEVIRLYGYDNINGQLLSNSQITNGAYSEYHKNVINTENALLASGYHEIITYSFVSEKQNKIFSDKKCQPIKLMNALSEEIAVMRTQLISSMMSCVAGNILRGNASSRLYEIASVYLADSLPLRDLPTERTHLCMCAFGEDEDFFTLKGSVEDVFYSLNLQPEIQSCAIEFLHGGRSAKIVLDGKTIGYMGEIHPAIASKYDISKRILVAEIDMHDVLHSEKPKIRYANFSRFSQSIRDMAIVVSNKVTHSDIVNTINSLKIPILEKVELFDVYSGEQVREGSKSMAYKLAFRHMERTLESGEIQSQFDRIVDEVYQKLGGVLR